MIYHWDKYIQKIHPVTASVNPPAISDITEICSEVPNMEHAGRYCFL
jgi:hypothetical protein